MVLTPQILFPNSYVTWTFWLVHWIIKIKFIKLQSFMESRYEFLHILHKRNIIYWNQFTTNVSKKKTSN